MQIHGFTDQQIAVGIEPTNESVAMVVEVALDLELVPQADAVVLGVHVGKITTESVGEHVVTTKRHLGHHSSNRQSLPRTVTNCSVVVVTTTPLGIEPNGSASDGTPGNLLRSRLCTGTNDRK